MQGTKYQVFAKFWDLLQGAGGAESYEFSRMRVQFMRTREIYQTEIKSNRNV